MTPGAIGDSRGEDHWRLCESDRSEALHDVKPGLAVERDGRTGPAFPPLSFVQAPDPRVGTVPLQKHRGAWRARAWGAGHTLDTHTNLTNHLKTNPPPSTHRKGPTGSRARPHSSHLSSHPEAEPAADETRRVATNQPHTTTNASRSSAVVWVSVMATAPRRGSSELDRKLMIINRSYTNRIVLPQVARYLAMEKRRTAAHQCIPAVAAVPRHPLSSGGPAPSQRTLNTTGEGRAQIELVA